MGIHDSTFKKIFSNKTMFMEFLEIFMPEIGKIINKDNLILENVSFMDPELFDRETDLLYRIKYDNKEVFLYVLTEHQSSVDQLMPFRILVYMTRIWERYIRELDKPTIKRVDFKLPLIIPIVFYTGINKWSAPTNFKDKVDSLIVNEALDNNTTYVDKNNSDHDKGKLKAFINRYIPNFSYELISLNEYDYKDFLKRYNPLNMLLSMDSVIISSVRSKGNVSVSEKLLEIVRELKTILNDNLSEEHKRLFRMYFAANMALIKQIFDMDIEMNMKDEMGGEEMLTIFEHNIRTVFEEGIEKGIKKGIEKGIKKGIEKGKEEGIKEGIRLSLDIKFGESGLEFFEQYVKDIKDLKILEELIAHIKKAKSVEELKGII